MRWLVLLVFIAALAVLLTVCGQPESSEPAPDIPEWAHVAPQQIAEAKKHGVPVAFENDLGMRFVLIPEGRFVMGSPEDEEGRINHETQHEVTISKPFYMQITEVTNGEYRKYKPDHQSGAHDGHSLDGENQPVVEVSWEDAEAFAAWLGKQDPSRSYRLPTEAEWEHACRAGTRTAYAWGDDAAEGWRHANANDPMTKEAFGFPWDGWPRDDGHRVTAPVASYPTNVWGLYDLSGNVSEWCSDWYGEYARGRATDPTGPASGAWRVLRGGSWYNYPGDVRSAYRSRDDPDFRFLSGGLRLVASVAQ